MEEIKEFFDDQPPATLQPDQQETDELYRDFSNLREFHVLDEIETNVNDDDDDDGKETRESDSSSFNEADSESDFEIEDDEIDAMLEEGKNPSNVLYFVTVVK